MNLEKFLGSKAKVDIIKYLLFKRQGISLRALEHEIPWTFPAIKKQVDSLLEAEIVTVDKDKLKRSIYMDEKIMPIIRSLFMFSLITDIKKLFTTYEIMIEKYFLGKVFGNPVDIDLIIIFKDADAMALDKMKEEINDLFRKYFIDTVALVLMSNDEFSKRQRLADKFVLNLLQNIKDPIK